MQGIEIRATGRVGWGSNRPRAYYYVAHIYLIHAVAIAVALLAFDVSSLGPASKPAGWGFALPVVYAVWGLVVVSLYPLCRWFADVKRRRSDWWLSYL